MRILQQIVIVPEVIYVYFKPFLLELEQRPTVQRYRISDKDMNKVDLRVTFEVLSMFISIVLRIGSVCAVQVYKHDMSLECSAVALTHHPPNIFASISTLTLFAKQNHV